MTTMASQITSLTVVYSDADQRKHQSSLSLAFVCGIHRGQWIPRTKGQLCGKCFHLMTSSCHFTASAEDCNVDKEFQYVPCPQWVHIIQTDDEIDPSWESNMVINTWPMRPWLWHHSFSERTDHSGLFLAIHGTLLWRVRVTENPHQHREAQGWF